MILTKRVAIAVLLVITVTHLHAQNCVSAKAPTKTYWLKYSLVFMHGCAPRVFPDNIIFTEGSCYVDPYAGRILPRGSKVELKSIIRDKGFAKVSFKVDSGDYEILVKNDSGRSFRESFSLLFTDKRLTEWYDMDCPDDIKTKRDVIRCLGFPISITKNGDVALYYYILEFVGPSPYGSYDGFNISIRKGKVVDVSGYI